MKLQISILTIALLCLIGCSPQMITTEQNEEIQKALRDEIKATTLRVFEKFKAGDSNEIEQLFSEEVLQQNPDLSQLI